MIAIVIADAIATVIVTKRANNLCGSLGFLSKTAFYLKKLQKGLQNNEYQQGDNTTY